MSNTHTTFAVLQTLAIVVGQTTHPIPGGLITITTFEALRPADHIRFQFYVEETVAVMGGPLHTSHYPSVRVENDSQGVDNLFWVPIPELVKNLTQMGVQALDRV